MEITYGNREGRYFTEWRFEYLKELLDIIHVGPCPPRTEVLEVESPEIWYDPVEDYHRLKFICRGREVQVRFYKVFSYLIDDADGWRTFPQCKMNARAMDIRRSLGVVIPQNADGQ